MRFGGIAALSGVSLDAKAGEVLGIIGPNGAGKTTLFDVDLRRSRAPNDGRVVLDGNDITSKSAVQRARRGLRRTFQRVQTFGWLSVEDNVLTALEWHGGGGGFLADLVMFPTRRVARTRPATARRRGDRAVRPRPRSARSSPVRCRSASRAWSSSRARSSTSRRLLLLDEPASGLDETEAERLGDQIDAVRDETGCAVLLVEHNAGFVMQHSNRVVVLDLGSVLAEGLPDEIQRNQAVRDAYLGESS